RIRAHAGAHQPQPADARGRHRPGRAPDQHRAAPGRHGREARRGPAGPEAPLGRTDQGRKRGGSLMTTTEPRPPTAADVCAELQKIYEKAQTFKRLLTTDAPVAQTPKTVVWTLNKAKLYRYAPAVPPGKAHKLPLFLVFAIMNRPHVLDLRPGHSFVEYMLRHGHDVYLLDWGVPGPEDRDLKFDDYTLEYLPRAIRKVKSVAGSDRFNMLGWCLGALISTMYASLRPDDGLKNLVLLTAPLDFTDKTAGGFIRWTSTQTFSADRIVDMFGNVPGEMIDYGAKALKPVENFVRSYVNLWDNIENPKVVEAWH